MNLQFPGWLGFCSQTEWYISLLPIHYLHREKQCNQSSGNPKFASQTLTWKLCPLFVQRSVNFFLTCLLPTFCAGCWTTRNMREKYALGDNTLVTDEGKGIIWGRLAAHMSHVPKRWSRDLILIMDKFPMWSMSFSNFTKFHYFGGMVSLNNSIAITVCWVLFDTSCYYCLPAFGCWSGIIFWHLWMMMMLIKKKINVRLIQLS